MYSLTKKLFLTFRYSTFTPWAIYTVGTCDVYVLGQRVTKVLFLFVFRTISIYRKLKKSSGIWNSVNYDCWNIIACLATCSVFETKVVLWFSLCAQLSLCLSSWLMNVHDCSGDPCMIRSQTIQRTQTNNQQNGRVHWNYIYKVGTWGIKISILYKNHIQACKTKMWKFKH